MSDSIIEALKIIGGIFLFFLILAPTVISFISLRLIGDIAAFLILLNFYLLCFIKLNDQKNFCIFKVKIYENL